MGQRYIVGIIDDKIAHSPEPCCFSEEGLDGEAFWENHEDCDSIDIGTKQELLSKYGDEIDEDNFADAGGVV